MSTVPDVSMGDTTHKPTLSESISEAISTMGDSADREYEDCETKARDRLREMINVLNRHEDAMAASPELLEIVRFFPALKVAAQLLEELFEEMVFDDASAKVHMGRIIATLKSLAERSCAAIAKATGKGGAV